MSEPLKEAIIEFWQWCNTEGQAHKMSEHMVEIGSNDSVVINKLFGPLILANLRISVDATTGDWLIEREWIKKGEYIPWVSIPGQIAQEFTDQDS